MNLSKKQASQPPPHIQQARTYAQMPTLYPKVVATGRPSSEPQWPGQTQSEYLDIIEEFEKLRQSLAIPKSTQDSAESFLRMSKIAAGGVLAPGNQYGDISVDFFKQVKKELNTFREKTHGQPTPAQMTIFLRCIANATLVERLHGSDQSINHLKNSISSNLTALGETDNESNLNTIYTSLLSGWESLYAKITEEVTHRDSNAMLSKIKQVLRNSTWKELVDSTYTLVAKALLTSQNAKDVLQAWLLAQLNDLINLQVGRDLLPDGSPKPGSALEQALQTFLSQMNAKFN